MKNLLFLIISAIHIVSFFQANSVDGFRQVTVVEFFHSHAHESDHEHLASHHSHEEEHNLPDSEKSHKHEVYVTGQLPYIHNEFIPTVPEIPHTVLFSEFRFEPPQDPFLHGIFRPPIYS